MRVLLLLLTCLPASLALAEEAPTYVRPKLLVEVSELQAWLSGDKRIGDQQLTLLDARSIEAYQEGRISAARHVNVAEWKAAFGDGTDAKEWSARIGKVLSGTDSTVIIYDDALTGNAARIWWIMKYWGVEDVRIVNGGFSAWKAAGATVYPTVSHRTEPVEFDAKPHLERLATIDEVLELGAQSDGLTCLIDVRTDRECAGGVIPKSTHLDWQELIDPDTKKLRPAEELRVLLERVGFDAEKPTITYCQSGRRASVMAFAVELMGGEQVANYYGSWGEWSRQETGDRRK
ncbi:MAG: sulfurtransferase [Aeoliella sp.]